jgi:hypothetical protein
MSTIPSTRPATLPLGKRGGLEGVARRHGRRRNPARTTPRSSLRTLNNQPHHSVQRRVEKRGRSITNSETPQCPSTLPRSLRELAACWERIGDGWAGAERWSGGSSAAGPSDLRAGAIHRRRISAASRPRRRSRQAGRRYRFELSRACWRAVPAELVSGTGTVVYAEDAGASASRTRLLLPAFSKQHSVAAVYPPSAGAVQSLARRQVGSHVVFARVHTASDPREARCAAAGWSRSSGGLRDNRGQLRRADIDK